MQHSFRVAAGSLVLVLGTFCAAGNRGLAVLADSNPPSESALSDAICPVVYPLDETPSDQGYHYLFYGNAFFINKDGYLVTAAHVLKVFRNGGGQPYILLNRSVAPPVFLKADLVAVDWEHDVGVLRANPNPFEGRQRVAYLSLTPQLLSVGDKVLSLAQRAVDVENASTFRPMLSDRLTGEVLDYQFTQQEKRAPETELLLFGHEVLRGQSGAPVLSAETHQVVGIIDGRWLRPVAVHATAIGNSERSAAATLVGAAVRIHYAIALLKQRGISWETSQAALASTNPSAAQDERGKEKSDEESEQHSPVPVPISVVPAPYPPQSLFGGEVILDAVVDHEGRLGDVSVVHGDPPFLDKAQDAVQSWSFRPAHIEGKDVEARVGVVFEFAEPYLPSPKSRTHTYPEPQDVNDRAPVPTDTVEPEYPVRTVAEDSVVVLGRIDAEGQLTSTELIRDVPPFSDATLAAMRQWRFAPGKQAGEPVESAIVVVATFRRPALAGSAK